MTKSCYLFKFCQFWYAFKHPIFTINIYYELRQYYNTHSNEFGRRTLSQK